MSRYYYILRNKLWLNLGYVLVNRSHGKKVVTVHLYKGQQVRSNKYRLTDYSMDDAGWAKAVKFPELFI